MKKAGIIAVLLLLSGLYFSMKAQKPLKFDMRPRMEARAHVQKLFSMGLTDSAVNYARKMRSDNVFSYDDYDQVLALSEWHRGDKEAAYNRVLKSVDYALAMGTSGSSGFSHMLTDFEYCYALATDTFLEKMVTNKVREHYVAQDFPEVSIGYKLIWLDYLADKCNNRYRYERKRNTDSQRLKSIERDRYDGLAVIKEKFLAIMASKNTFYTWKEVGTGFDAQFSLLRTLSDSAMHEHFAPYYETAFLNKTITSEQYVYELLAHYHQGITLEQRKAVRDSLCNIYGCMLTSQRMVVTTNGDTLKFDEMTLTDTD